MFRVTRRRGLKMVFPNTQYLPQADVAHPDRLESEPEVYAPPHGVSEQSNYGQSVHPLRQFVHHRPDHQSPSEKAIEGCASNHLPAYLNDPAFKAFAKVSDFRIISYKQWAEEFMKLVGLAPGLGPPPFRPGFTMKIWDTIWIVEPTCPETVFGYMREELDDELALAVNRHPYEYFKLYMATAREKPLKIWDLFGGPKASIHQRHVRQAVREMLGAVAATEELAKKIYEQNGGVVGGHAPGTGSSEAKAKADNAKAEVDAFRKQAALWMTREQVEKLAPPQVDPMQLIPSNYPVL